MEKEQRNRLQKATQDARRLLEEEFRSQLLQTYDIDVEKVRWAEEPGAHLQAEQRLIREKLVAWIEHKEAQINDRKEALLLALREMAFTALNRFVALKLMEVRGLVRPCVSGGLESAGFLEFTAVAQGLLAEQESSYRLYLETIFEDVSRELRALFDPRDPASLLWPKRAALLELLDILNRPELAELWIEDETLGWVYQYFNGDAERKKMREESSAPRNSRELAVRNQFFTPRYVVEFLTDNTLGRIWYEMRQGNTKLKDRCHYLVRRLNEIWLQPGEEPPAQPDSDETPSQEELLRQPVYIPHRPLKDPREIRMLDPACGSMHFGLYAFDLYLEIYKEAWEIAQGSDEQSKQEEAFSSFFTYAASFADKPAFLREVPRLILQHNIHGIDIDPRATKIARLTLWLRAQRNWQEQQVEASARPVITRSNVVCAEPMPGEKALLRDFIEQQFPIGEQKAFKFLLETVFDHMTLAGEAGSLLRIEEEIRSTIAEAKRLWQAEPQYEQPGFFAEDLSSGLQASLSLDLSGITDTQFWEQAEQRIYYALQAYAEQVQDGSGFQRRLFVNDAAQGFAFIDICRQRYDVALMNPPFGDASLPSKKYIDERYGDTKGDVYKAFVECFHDRLLPSSHLGIISSRTGFFLGQSEDWRKRVVLQQYRPLVLADLGGGVLDAMVEVAAYVMRSLSLLEAEHLTYSLVPALKQASGTSHGYITLSKWQSSRGGLKRHQALAELEHLEAAGFVRRGPGDSPRYISLKNLVEKAPDVHALAYPELVCIRALSPESKESLLDISVKTLSAANTFICDPAEFASMPGAVFSYWISKGIRQLFKDSAQFETKRRNARIGLQTSDDFRFLRLWWEKEIDTANNDWVSFAKGGAFSRFYGDLHLSINWHNDGREIKAWVQSLPGCAHWSRRIASSEYYFRPGFTWPRRTNGLSVRTLPRNSIFADKGPSGFCDGDDGSELLACISIFNSSIFNYLIQAQLARVEMAQSFEAGIIQQTPFPITTIDQQVFLAEMGRKAWGAKRFPQTVTPNSHAFLKPALLSVSGSTLIERAAEWSARVHSNEEVLSTIQSHIDDLSFRLYGLESAERAALTSTLATEAPSDLEGEADEEEGGKAASAPVLAADLLAYALGCAFGRWDIRYATGEQAAPELPDPFAPLPVCPPGQLQNTQGLPARLEDVPSAYPVLVPWEGILVDDPKHPLDLERHIRKVIEIIWNGEDSGAKAESIEQEACEILGINALRDYFRKPADFFAGHLNRYSKSRRQAPIYWQLSAGNGNYSAWLYYHRFTKDTLYRVLRDFVEPRVQQAERESFELESQGALSGAAATQIQKAQTLLQDLRVLKIELDLVAPLWNPNLNDGVIINHAILWRITPYTPWQKKCKECWDKLVKGDYDWAHLAFHLWPERVIPKCTTDRSLAIAHGLEERLWQETNNGNWLPRQLSEADLQALIAEHSNPAVKSALERFLAAPPPVAPTRTRAQRTTRASGSSTPRRARGSAAVVDAEATRQVLLALTAAPSDGLAKAAIADLIGVEANALTAVIKQLKESGQIDQLGERRGARYVLSEQGRVVVGADAEEEA